MTTKGNEHQRAPWRDPSRQQEGERDPLDVRPPLDHVEKLYHWIATPLNPTGEPMRWGRTHWWGVNSTIVTPRMAAIVGWRWIAPCEPPKEGSFW